MSDIKYTADGQPCQVLATLPSGKFLVAGALGGYEDDQPWFDTDNPRVVERVFDAAPFQIYETRVSALMVEVRNLEQRRNELSTEISAAEREHKQRVAKLSKYEPLRLIEDLLDGKITHFVKCGTSYNIDLIKDPPHDIEVVSAADELKDQSERNYGRGTPLKLLSLFGDSNGDLTWRINQYKDGSGYWYQCWPFTSLESANEWAMHLYNRALSKPHTDRPWMLCVLAKTASRLGAEFPDHLRRIARDYQIQEARKAAGEAQVRLDEANAKLAALQS